MPFNLCMAAGLESSTATDVESEQNGRDEIEIGAYPVPFGESLSITIRGIVQEGATLQLLNHQGRPVRVVSLAGGRQLDAPVRFRDLRRPAPRTLHHPPAQWRHGGQQAHPEGPKSRLNSNNPRGAASEGKWPFFIHAQRWAGRSQVEDRFDRRECWPDRSSTRHRGPTAPSLHSTDRGARGPSRIFLRGI